MLTTLGDLLLQLWIWWVILPPTGSSPNLKWLWPCQDTVALRNKSGNKSIRSEMDRQAPLSLGFYSAQSVISLSVCVCENVFFCEHCETEHRHQRDSSRADLSARMKTPPVSLCWLHPLRGTEFTLEYSVVNQAFTRALTLQKHHSCNVHNCSRKKKTFFLFLQKYFQQIRSIYWILKTCFFSPSLQLKAVLLSPLWRFSSYESRGVKHVARGPKSAHLVVLSGPIDEFWK